MHAPDAADTPDEPGEPGKFEQQGEALDDEASYVCQSCGEEIVVPVDPAAGREQEYVEDCPVCCRPHLLVVRVDRQGGVSLDARAE